MCRFLHFEDLKHFSVIYLDTNQFSRLALKKTLLSEVVMKTKTAEQINNERSFTFCRFCYIFYHSSFCSDFNFFFHLGLDDKVVRYFSNNKLYVFLQEISLRISDTFLLRAKIFIYILSHIQTSTKN
jgi:hypothetical protein